MAINTGVYLHVMKNTQKNKNISNRTVIQSKQSCLLGFELRKEEKDQNE